MSKRISADQDGIGHFISVNELLVPAYQRPYSWKKEQIVQLLEDVTDAFVNGKEYFLGSVVLISAPGSRTNIVDGQQRLATTSILIAAIRDYFFINDPDSQRHTQIETDYLFKRHMRTRAFNPKLILSDSENEYFQKIIQGEEVLPVTKVEKKIAEALKLCTDHIELIIAGLSDTKKLDRLIDFLEFVSKNLEIIMVTTPDDGSAFTIFETLNDRGLVLSTADLVKNFLFRLSDDRLDEVKTNWHSMIGSFNATDNEDQLVSYINHYWNSKYGYSTGPQVFNEIKKKITNQQQAVQFIKELEESSKYYVALQNPQNTIWQRLSPDAQKSIETLSQLRLEQHKPLLLAVMRKFGSRNQIKMLKHLVNWSIRLMVTGGNRSGTISSTISRVAIDIDGGTLTTTADVGTAMKKVIPDDKEFSEAFSILKVSKGYTARYLLSKLESTARSEKGLSPELVVSESILQANLEHILPKNADLTKWNFTPEQADQSLNRLGNQAMLSSTQNSLIGSEEFSVKKNVYKSSKLLTTKNIASIGSWTQEEIDKRQLELAALSAKTWPQQ